MSSLRSETLRKRLQEKRAEARTGVPKHLLLSSAIQKATQDVASGAYDSQMRKLQRELEESGGDILTLCKKRGLNANYAAAILSAIRESETGTPLEKCVETAVESLNIKTT